MPFWNTQATFYINLVLTNIMSDKKDTGFTPVDLQRPRLPWRSAGVPSDRLSAPLSSAFKYPRLSISARGAFFSSPPSLPALSLGRRCLFLRLFFLPLFTWLFVLRCHIISLSDGVASRRAHNEEIAVARGLVSLHWGYHRMLGHATLQAWTPLADDRFFFLGSTITVCSSKNGDSVFVSFA